MRTPFCEKVDVAFQPVAARTLEEHEARAALLAAGIPAFESFGEVFRGPSTFMGTAIETIYIPANVTTIGASAFRNCYNLTTVTFDENCAITEINSELFYGEKGSKLNSINIPDTVTVIHARAFRNCDGLTEIELPASLVTIGPEAFYDCDSLESIHIPSSVTSIGAPEELNKNTITGYTFKDCNNLKSVTFGSDIDLSEIYTHTFSGCNSLESIVIPAGVKYIREYAFDHCTSLKSVTFMSNDNLQVIENNAFEYCITLEEIAIPSSVTAIGDRVFAVCYSNENGVRTGLKKVTFGENSQLTTVGAGAFSSCGLMSECKLPDTVTSIGANAFYSCQSLKEIYIPAGVTTIYANTFYGCNAATKVYVPLGLTTIQAEAFIGCKNIDAIYYGGCCESQWNAISIGTQTSDNNSWDNATIHYIVDHVLGEATCTVGAICEKCGCEHTAPLGHIFEGPWSTISTTTEASAGVDKGHCARCDQDVEIIASLGLAYTENLDDENNVISYNVAGIGSCTDTDIIIPRTYHGLPVVAIDADAFINNSKITSVTMLDTITTIGARAFEKCVALVKVRLSDDVTTIENRAFYNCKKLQEIKFGDSVETIGERALSYCNSLTSITLPASLTTLGISSTTASAAVFHSTPLADIYYKGTEEQWNAITMGSADSNAIANAKIHFAE